MAMPEKELEKQLTEVGKKLRPPPPSASELVKLLDRVENLLSRVEQSPSDSMKKALSLSMEALVSNELLRHPDIDVNVSVAACISEITRITAPDAPYGDEEMKEVFQLIVSSFKNLDDKGSPSYYKRTCILDTVAKVRSCVVMLDLECDALVVEMFRNFFNSISKYHPENVYSSMETIMCLVLEESEDVSEDLLSPILDALSLEKEVMPVVRLLGERVALKCATKLKPYMLPAIKSRGTTIGDYKPILAEILQVENEAVEPSDADAASKHVADENDVANAPSEKAVEVAVETLDDAPPAEEVGPAAITDSPKSALSNGVIQKEVEGTSAGDDNPKEENNAVHDEAALPMKAKVDNSDTEELTKLRPKREKSSKRKGRKSNSAKGSKSSSEPLKPTLTDEKEGKVTHELEKIAGKNVDNAQGEASVAGSSEPAGNKKEPAENEKEPAENKEESAENKEEPADNKEEPAGNEEKAAENKEEAAENKEEAAEDKEEAAEDKEEAAEDKEEAAEDKEEAAEDKEVAAEDKEPAKDKKEPAENKEVPAENKKEPAENKQEPEALLPSPKTSDDPVDVPSPSPSGSLADETHLIKAGQGKKKDEMVDSVPADVDLKKESDTKKPSKGTISESKSHKRKGKKVSSAADKEDSVPSSADASKKEDEKTSEAKLAKQSSKKVEQAGSQRDKKKKGQGKGTPTKDLTKTPAKDEGKKSTGSAKSTAKSAKTESDVERASKSSSKRKRASESNNTSKYGKELVGSTVKVWWPDDKKFYGGVVDHFEKKTGKHKVLYDDGDVEVLKLEEEKWKLIKYGSTADQGHSSDGESPDESTETPKAKKAKISPAQGAKQGKTETSTKKAGASSSKSKATTKSRTKQKDDNKADGQAKDETLKSIAKSDDDKSGKTKESKSGNKTSDSTPKSVGKSKDKNDLDTSKGSNKSKQEAPKSASKSKGKSPKTGSKSNTNGSSKAKPTVSVSEMEEDTEDVESSPEPPPKAPETSKVKSQSASKSKKKSGKKRKRSTKG